MLGRLTVSTVHVLSVLLCLGAASTARAAQQDETSELEAPAAADKPVGAVNIGIVAGYGLAMLGPGTLTAQNPYAGGFGVQVDHQFESGIVLGFGVITSWEKRFRAPPTHKASFNQRNTHATCSGTLGSGTTFACMRWAAGLICDLPFGSGQRSRV